MNQPSDERPRIAARGAAADFLVAVVLIFLCVAAAYLSLQMERPRGWLSAPGLLPFLLSTMLVAMFGAIASKAIRRGALTELARSMRSSRWSETLTDERRLRVFLAAGIIAVYYFLLLRFLPFEISTMVFFLLVFAVFWESASWIRRIITGATLTIAVTAGFRGFFGIILPGQGDLLGTALYWLNN